MKILKFICLVIIALLFSHCTSNPFFGGDVISKKSLTLQGKVTLEEEQDHSNTFVWLRRLNVKTRTKADGSFVLNLPNPKALPGGALAWNGEFPVYFYMSNFKIDSVMVFILNGELRLDQDNVTTNGHLKNNRRLEKIIQITSYFTHDSIKANFPGFVKVKLEIEPKQEGYTFFSYLASRKNLKAFFFYKLDNPSKGRIIRYLDNDPQLPKPYRYTGILNKTLRGSIRLVADLSIGHYIVIPYIHIFQDGIPAEMYHELGANSKEFNRSYLSMPMTYESEVLTAYHQKP